MQSKTVKVNFAGVDLTCHIQDKEITQITDAENKIVPILRNITLLKIIKLVNKQL